jgi:hypothetical protein
MDSVRAKTSAIPGLSHASGTEDEAGSPPAASRAGAEGEGQKDGPAFVDQIAALANDCRSYFNSDGLPWSCIYPDQASRD